MKICHISPIQGEYVLFTNGNEYFRYSRDGSWYAIVDTCTGEIEQFVDDESLQKQLEAAYQEYIQ